MWRQAQKSITVSLRTAALALSRTCPLSLEVEPKLSTCIQKISYSSCLHGTSRPLHQVTKEGLILGFAAPSVYVHFRGALGRSMCSLSSNLTSSHRRALTLWLGGCTGWVFSMVVLGGYTRLTRSGLSMTDWKFTGERPPRSLIEWQNEFDRYKESPEYKKVNLGMSLDDFKYIYYVEWAHRMWGRALGLVFAVPAAYFVSRGMINKHLAKRLGLLFLMGGTQGVVGWWMVRSGLIEPENNAIPRVSPYRLAAHLTSAFAIYATLVWTTLGIAQPFSNFAAVQGTTALEALKRLRRGAIPVAALVAVTAASGAFVAGLDAGHAYNTFPLMNGGWIPKEYFAISNWRNMFENTAAVQLHHRVLALSTLAAVAGLWYKGTQRSPNLPPYPRLLLHMLMGVAAAQVALGIATLLLYVPVELGSAHQAGALTLFTVLLGLLHATQPAGGTPLWLAKSASPIAAVATLGIGYAVTRTM